jgi:hypothetical protein
MKIISNISASLLLDKGVGRDNRLGDSFVALLLLLASPVS